MNLNLLVALPPSVPDRSLVCATVEVEVFPGSLAAWSSVPAASLASPDPAYMALALRSTPTRPGGNRARHLPAMPSFDSPQLWNSFQSARNGTSCGHRTPPPCTAVDSYLLLCSGVNTNRFECGQGMERRRTHERSHSSRKRLFGTDLC